MKGYVARKGNRWYAVMYEGLDAVTGKERRRWHPAGTTREEAERLVARLAAEVNGRNDTVRSLTFGAYLTSRWLPGKKINLARSTWDGYRRKIDRHILPVIGRMPIRRLRAHHLEGLYDRMLHPPTDAGRWHRRPHLIIRGALNDAVVRGLVNRNVALVAHAPEVEGDSEGRAACVDSPAVTGVSVYCGRSSTVPSVLASRRHRDAAQRASGAPLGRHRPQEGQAVGQPRDGGGRIRDA